MALSGFVYQCCTNCIKETVGHIPSFYLKQNIFKTKQKTWHFLHQHSFSCDSIELVWFCLRMLQQSVAIPAFHIELLSFAIFPVVMWSLMISLCLFPISLMDSSGSHCTVRGVFLLFLQRPMFCIYAQSMTTDDHVHSASVWLLGL